MNKQYRLIEDFGLWKKDDVVTADKIGNDQIRVARPPIPGYPTIVFSYIPITVLEGL